MSGLHLLQLNYHNAVFSRYIVSLLQAICYSTHRWELGMPQIYTHPDFPRRGQSSTSSASMSNIQPQASDADDTIVLSDLIRTGEASRLRRRGAMRLDHASGSSTQARNIVVVERPSWESDYENDVDPSEGHLGASSGRSSSMRYTRRRQRSSRRYGPYASTTAEQQADEAMFTLVCGVESYAPCELEPFKPSILPLYPPPEEDSQQVTGKRSTGCGALLHVRASPRPRIGFWSACGPASTAVVPMDADYFDSKEAGRRVRASCGCIKEGIGCAVCGNTLGTRFIPCKSASDGFYCSKHTEKSQSARLRGPEGPQYWRASSSSTSPTPNHTIYSFFADAVTSTPGYAFPSPSQKYERVRPPQLYNTASEESLNFNSYSPVFNGRNLPEPISSEDEDEEPYYGGEWHQSTYITQDDSSSNTNLLQTPVTNANMILDRWVTSSPAPLSEHEDNADDTDLTAAAYQVSRQLNHSSSHNHRSGRSHTAPPAAATDVMIPVASPMRDPPTSFYQQQILGAWERERERERERSDMRMRLLGDGPHPVGDQDGSTALVWGSVNAAPGSTADMEEPGSPDKTEGVFVFPPR